MIELRSPCCGRLLRGAPLQSYATVVVDRTCRRCHRRYRVVIRPLAATAAMHVHQIDWTPEEEK